MEEFRNGRDFVYIHIEAPDECGHRGEAQNKVKAIEEIDRRILMPLADELGHMGDFRLMVLPDHPTPLSIRTHTDTPVPYLIYSNCGGAASGISSFTESGAAETGLFIDQGQALIRRLFQQ